MAWRMTVRRWRRGPALPAVDLSTSVGSVRLPNPVMTAAGTAGHGAELADAVDLAALGAVVTKSQAPFAWAGNSPPRLCAVPAGMVNAVGLQGAGVSAWLTHDLPPLLATGARVVASIWGHTVDDYAEAALLLAGAPDGVVAVEVNLSCPNHHGKGMFAQSADATHDAVAAASACRRPRWAKLTAMVTDLGDVARAAHEGGAEAVTLVNTLPAMVIDVERRCSSLGAPVGGLSGAAMHPVAVRAVHDVHAALPDLPIVGVGGVTDATTAVELLLAGASAVQVGTATFADRRAVATVVAHLARWCADHGVRRVADLIGGAHGHA
jgi:dihydroorotate dehydrogenase (NAD+) catalytic subunit